MACYAMSEKMIEVGVGVGIAWGLGVETCSQKKLEEAAPKKFPLHPRG